jgi:3-hydroxyacyl-[acyl-carrier-protein] dehydratase
LISRTKSSKLLILKSKNLKIKQMTEKFLNKLQISELLPHREPMLLIDELLNIKKLFSATAIVNVRKDSFFVQGHFPDNPVMPGVLIVEAFGQAAAALTAHGLDKETYNNKLVFLMGIEKARFRNPVIPDCKLELNIQAIRTHGRVWKYKGDAFVNGKKMADAQWSATIVDKK